MNHDAGTHKPFFAPSLGELPKWVRSFVRPPRPAVRRSVRSCTAYWTLAEANYISAECGSVSRPSSSYCMYVCIYLSVYLQTFIHIDFHRLVRVGHHLMARTYPPTYLPTSPRGPKPRCTHPKETRPETTAV